MSQEVWTWWVILCAAAAINIVAWGGSAWLLGHRRERWPADSYATRRQVLFLAAIYVLGCAFRSVLPMIEVPRMCLHDVWLSTAAITRTVATVAEVAFILQWVLLLREAGAATGSRVATHVSGLLLPVIVAAELSCWHAVLTGDYLSHALENSLWTVAAALALAAFVAMWPRADAALRRVLAGGIGGGAAYIAFMASYDVPMYLRRWQAALAAGHEGRSLADGWQAALQPCVVQTDWVVWHDDAVWLTLYFTFAVWTSIALAHVPPFRHNPSVTAKEGQG